MKKTLAMTMLLSIFLSCVDAQTTNYRTRFSYRISKHKLEKLNDDGYYITDNANARYSLCDKNKRKFLLWDTGKTKTSKLKFLVTNTSGVLTLDPWSIVNTSKDPDPCSGAANVISSNTPNNLKIVIPGRTNVGDPTLKIKLRYQSWIFGVNVIGVKFRPKVKDYTDSSYSNNVITGTINLGLAAGRSYGWTTFTPRSSNSYSITPSLSCGFSSVSLSKEPLKKNISFKYTPSNFVVSPAGSIIFARNDIGIILSYGFDIMCGRHADAWAYQGKGFIGIGVAAGLKL